MYYANYDEKHGFYMAHLDAGKINIDGLDTDSDEKKLMMRYLMK